MRYLQVNKFSYILTRLFKVNRSDLLTNENIYDKFLKATLCECLLSFLFLLFSISFFFSILNFIQNMTQIIHDSKQDESFQYIFNIFNDSRPNYESLKHLYSHSRSDSFLFVQEFYSNHKLNKINCSQLESKTAQCLNDCCFILVLKNENKIDQIGIGNQFNISKLSHGKATSIHLIYLNKNLKFISNLQILHEFGPNEIVFTQFKFNSLNTSDLTYKLIFFCFFCACIFSLYFLIDEIFKIAMYKYDYFYIALNLVDLALVVFIFSFIIIHILISTHASSFQSRLILYKMYNQMTNLIEYQNKQLNLSIIMILFSWFKLYKFINFTVGITQMNATLSLAFPDLLCYLVAFLLILSGFSVLLNRIFGAISSELNSVFKAQFSLLKFLIGLADFKILFDYNSKTARVIFFTYFLFVFIIFLNIFLAIINTCYSYVLRTYAKQSELDYYEFFKKRFLHLKSKYQKEIKNDSVNDEIHSPKISLIEANEITESITASKFRVYLLRNIKRIENADIDVVYRMNNIREKGLKRFTDAFEKIYGNLEQELELDFEVETKLTPEQCREIIIKLNLAKKRMSFLKNSQYLRKKSFFKPVFYQDNAQVNTAIKCPSSLSVLSSISSLKSRSSTNSKTDQKGDQMSNGNINHELSFKEFDNVHTELVSWKEFINLKKSLNHLQNEINSISSNFINELK